MRQRKKNGWNSLAQIPYDGQVLLSISSITPPDVNKWKDLPASFAYAVKACESVAKKMKADTALSSINITTAYMEAVHPSQVVRHKCELDISKSFLVKAGILGGLLKAKPKQYQITDKWFWLKNATARYAIPIYHGDFIDINSWLRPGKKSVRFPKVLLEDFPLIKYALDEDEEVEVSIGDGEYTLTANGKKIKSSVSADMSADVGNFSFRISPDLLQRIIKDSHECTIDEKAIRILSDSYSYVATICRYQADCNNVGVAQDSESNKSIAQQSDELQTAASATVSHNHEQRPQELGGSAVETSVPPIKDNNTMEKVIGSTATRVPEAGFYPYSDPETGTNYFNYLWPDGFKFEVPRTKIEGFGNVFVSNRYTAQMLRIGYDKPNGSVSCCEKKVDQIRKDNPSLFEEGVDYVTADFCYRGRNTRACFYSLTGLIKLADLCENQFGEHLKQTVPQKFSEAEEFRAAEEKRVADERAARRALLQAQSTAAPADSTGSSDGDVTQNAGETDEARMANLRAIVSHF